MVANVITYRARSVLRDVAKTFGFTPAQVDEVRVAIGELTAHAEGA